MEKRYENKGYLLEDFRLFHLDDAQGAKMDYHYHEFHKLLFILSGAGSYAVEGQRYHLRPGDVMLVGRHCVHKPEFEPGLPYERIILYLSPEFLRKESADECDLGEFFSGKHGRVLRLEEGQVRELHGLLERLEQELAQDRFGRIILSKGMLIQILVEVGRHLQQGQAKMPAPVQPKDGRIQEVLRYLEQHLTEELNIDGLAERFYISRFHLMHRFRQETGTTIHSYVAERRLLLARNLITQGVPATEACFSCGYGSYSSFSRAYRKLFGMTPTGRLGGVVTEETFE